MNGDQMFQNFLKFAETMGKLEAGQESIKNDLNNHLSSHKFDKLFYIVVVAIQIITFILLKVKL